MQTVHGLSADQIASGEQRTESAGLSREDAVALADAVIACEGTVDLIVNGFTDLQARVDAPWSERDADCVASKLDLNEVRDVFAAVYMRDADAATVAPETMAAFNGRLSDAVIGCGLFPKVRNRLPGHEPQGRHATKPDCWKQPGLWPDLSRGDFYRSWAGAKYG